MASVTYRSASRIFPGTPPVRAVDDLDLDVADGEFLVLVGASGSGKSTALRMLAGLEDVDEGTVEIAGEDVSGVEPAKRDIAMVFQSYALYPHMTVAANMAFSLRLRGGSKDDVRRRVEEAAAMLDLTPYLDRKPRALSGGQRQRVAMGRAIVREPAVFLMDEPLSNLDAKLRVETRANLAALQRRLGTTTLYVTHDQVEAMTMGHRVAVLAEGRLQQCDTPRALYERPANTYVAGFIGSPAMTLLPARAWGSLVPDDRSVPGGTVGLRPEALVPGSGGPDELELVVELVEELGADAYVYGATEVDGEHHRVVTRTDARSTPAVGQRIRVALRSPADVHRFGADGLRVS
ncbi:ABC transporter ATP-binding protein [Actinomycetospora sp. CA-084318]|uniref:ABC transporter ATP-binding protein n=1 Tax=Actinomycetospora sp. CA-084318 TaxID=3239892 RepID=UPI003D97F50E